VSSTLEEDVAFIFSECKRLEAEMLSGRAVVPNSPEAMEFFYRLPHPEVSWSFMICGRQADARLRSLADKAARNAGLNKQVATATIRNELAAILVRKFIKECREVSSKNVSRAMAEAAKRSANKLEDLVHYVPCHLMIIQSPATFSVGPVSFFSQRAFRSRIAHQIAVSRTKHPRSRRYILRVLRYYRSFGWIAEVPVNGCDRETSEQLAVAATTAAVDCIQLLFGAAHTHKMVIGGPNLSKDWQGSLVVSSKKGLSYSVGFRGAGSVAFEDDWHQLLEGSDGAHLLELCGLAVASITDRVDRPLSRRFLDAATWFGEAVRDKSPAAKIVRYVTALERMVMTEEHDDIASTLSKRAAAVCSVDALQVFDKLSTELKQLYHLRSKLVHGSISPHSDAVMAGVRSGAELARETLLSTLNLFGELGLAETNVGQKRLASWFNNVVEQVLASQLERSNRSDNSITLAPH
jgi:hypothetical protein